MNWLRRAPGGRILTFCAACVTIAPGTQMLQAQDFGRAANFIDPTASERGGVHLYSVTAGVNYYSTGIPTLAMVPVAASSSDVSLDVSAAFGWTKRLSGSSFSVTFTPSYFAEVRNSSFHIFDPGLSLNWSANPHTGRWKFTFSGSGAVRTLHDSMFNPTLASTLASAPISFDDLAAAALQGQVTNGQLASVLTGSPVSPAAPLGFYLYGYRYFSGYLAANLGYAVSSRLNVGVTVQGSENIHLSNPTGISSAAYPSLLNSTTAAGVSLAVDYSLDSRTTLSGAVATSKMFGGFQNYAPVTADVNLSRRMSRRWFLRLHGGGGTIVPFGVENAVRTAIQYAAGGGLGYKTYTHTLLASVDRRIGDTYGIGAGNSMLTTAAWSWKRPGRSWWAQSSLSQQRLSGGPIGNPSSWQATGGVGWKLTRHTSVQAQYSYLKYSGLASLAALSESVVRMVVTWQPKAGPDQ